ncbi:MAG: thioredoxin domain-containing protein, partial [Brevinematales bacterium]
QRFHLPRAIFICNQIGTKAEGVIADRRSYRQYAHNFWRLRELVATLTALWDVWVRHPTPVLGNIEPIFEQTSKEIPDMLFAKVNVDEEGELAMRYGISSIPALILFHKEQPVATHVGTISKERLKEWIKNHR